MRFLIFTLIPLILSIGIAPAIPFSNATEYDQICIDKVWLENSRGKIACVTQSTADKLVERGWGALLDDNAFSEPKACTLDYTPVCGVDGEVYGNMCALESSNVELAYRGECNYTGQYGIDYGEEKFLVPVGDGGTDPLTVTPVLGNPTKTYPEFYVPGEEELEEDEIRIIFCGTGMPYVTYLQGASCVIVQTGDGRSILLDLGSGSIGRINSLKIPGDELTHVFVSHLHTDHIGDLGPFWSQAYLSGRTVPIELYGPTGEDPSLGTTVFVEKFLESWKWDYETRNGRVMNTGMAINAHEFDFSKTHVIFEEDDLKVTSFPAVHAIDGSVSYRVDWNDLSVVFSGDTNVNTYLVENSQNVDVVILETFLPFEAFERQFGFSQELYDTTLANAHIPAERAGLFFEIAQPRLAVMYHQVVDAPSMEPLFEDIRKGYMGPAIFAQDFTVINITPDSIVSRQADFDGNSLPIPLKDKVATGTSNYFLSEWLEASVLYEDDLRKIIVEKNGN